MVDLKNEVQKRGFTVAHIKTDSIKIPDATPDIIDFVMQFGKKYGYTFEHEATYDRMCLVNDAVYIAKYKNHEDKFVLSTGEKVITSWTATGKQFAVPYVFKSLFSRTPINFDDMCETMSVTSSLYLDMNERLPKLSADDEKELGILKRLHNFDNEQDIEKVRKKYNYTPERMEERYSELIEKEKDTHDYIFVGRVGQFCPIQDGCGGGLLMREKDGKYYAATGSKGYRWLESETVRALAKEDCIDMSYYETMANKAVETISKYGDYKWFISDEPYINHLSED